ncbi:MAG: flagellar biosynthetic protein FliO [Simplicispira suum]|uniref:FliO/MopB family protein n=1 Tax=Simplicispira suum TaxID=2109915 RepID=UPI001C6AAD72|nr:flagellar biosynthetic protein FliO [Simplicispira suum]MBW7832820.1 flagellar biosynthetic protein FliO [Simplicispira suum]
MTQTLLLVVLFVAGIATLPWVVRRVQQRHGGVAGASAASPRVLSAIAVGPHQRVVTVEVGEEGERTTLVLGVTPQSIRCLHTQPARRGSMASPTSFSLEMTNAVASVPQADKDA